MNVRYILNCYLMIEKLFFVWKINTNISIGNPYGFEHMIFLMKIDTIFFVILNCYLMIEKLFFVCTINTNISIGNPYGFEHMIFLMKIDTIFFVNISKIFIVKIPKIFVVNMSDWNYDFYWFCYTFDTVIFCIKNPVKTLSWIRISRSQTFFYWFCYIFEIVILYWKSRKHFPFKINCFCQPHFPTENQYKMFYWIYSRYILNLRYCFANQYKFFYYWKSIDCCQHHFSTEI